MDLGAAPCRTPRRAAMSAMVFCGSATICGASALGAVKTTQSVWRDGAFGGGRARLVPGVRLRSQAGNVAVHARDTG